MAGGLIVRRADADRSTLRRILGPQLVRVIYAQTFGWPTPTDVEVRQRTYNTERRAAEMIAALDHPRPGYHALVGVWATSTDWTPLDPERVYATLPDDEETP